MLRRSLGVAQLSRRGGFLALAALAGALAAATTACESKALLPLGGAAGGGGNSRPGARDASADDGKLWVIDGSVDHQSVDVTPRPVGAGCNGSASCLSGFCVDGICCTSACVGGCNTCVAPGAVGTCVARAAGARPRQAMNCPPDVPASCGSDGTCDGAGACRLYLGNTCAPGICANGVVTGAFLCNGLGVCQPGPTIICAPYGCDPVTNYCLSQCQDDSQCFGGQHCQGGSCRGDGLSGAGQCKAGSDCISGHCIDGVCCDTACSGPCVSCALPGRLGACSPIPAGAPDPRGLCLDQGAPSCGHNGTCDGAGGCSLYAAGVICAATPSCSGTTWSSPGTCSGTGACQRQTIPCLPYACDVQTNACHGTCVTADDCGPGKPCVNGICGNPPPASCSAADECASGFCAQGACCLTKCDGPCFSCALPGTIGTCLPVPAPPDAGACAP